MNEPRIDFLAQILKEAEVADRDKKLALGRVEADHFLMSVKVLEDEMETVQRTADAEVELIRSWAMTTLDGLNRKRQYLLMNLESFMKDAGERSLSLPHGSMKVRKLRDRVLITNLDEFIPHGLKLGLVKTKQTQAPDLNALLEYTRRTKVIVPGTNLISGEEKFYYSTNGKDGDDESE